MAAFRPFAAYRQLREVYKLSGASFMPCHLKQSRLVLSVSPFTRQSLSDTNSTVTAQNILRLHYRHVHVLSSPQSQISKSQSRNYCEEADKHKTEVSYEELLALIESDDVQLFDVREPKEIEETGTIPSATNIPLTRVKEALSMDEVKFAEIFGASHPDKYDRNIVFFGLGPIKSTAALELAFKLGYKKARHFPGGWEEWSNKLK